MEKGFYFCFISSQHKAKNMLTSAFSASAVSYEIFVLAKTSLGLGPIGKPDFY
jgi:hypothetical protein